MSGCACCGCAPHPGARAVGGGICCGWESSRGAGVSVALDLGQLGPQAPLCVCLCVCVRPCGSALEPLGTHRNVAPLRSPSCPGSTWKWPPGKEKGGEGRGGGECPEPAIRRAQNQRQTKDSSSHPFPGEAKGEARTSQAPLAADGAPRVRLSGERRRGVPACVYGDRGDRSIPLGALMKGRAAVGPGCALGPVPRRRGAPARGIS